MAVEIKRVERDFVPGETARHLGTQLLGMVVGERVLTLREYGSVGHTEHLVDVRMHGTGVERTYRACMFTPHSH